MSKDPRSRLLDWLRTGELPRPKDPTDAAAIGSAARTEKVAGLLYARLEEQDAPWPQATRDVLRAGYVAVFATGARRLDLAARVTALLGARDLRTLPLKGAAVAERGYDSVAERPMGDVDILALDDFTSSVRVLREAGFREREKADHAWALVETASGDVVELHHSVTSCAGFFPVETDGLWARSRPGRGVIQRLPSAEDLLVHLSLHAAFQHGLALTLVQHLDLRRVLERERVDEDALLRIAAGARAEGALAVALLAAETLVGAPLGGALRRALESRLPDGWRNNRARSVARTRWALSRGRRLEFAWRTVAPQVPGVPTGLAPRLLRASARAASLLRRWGPEALRG